MVPAPGAGRDTSDPAVRKIGPARFHPHELRHTAASLAIASGADVKVVGLVLGHRTATMTLGLCGHLFPDRARRARRPLRRRRVCTRCEPGATDDAGEADQ
ncbi:tyrosine-type recombinase/integrase [Actinomycetospora sp. TBRC 11914]|uniref:tyrosine-type recombinase/integrase n=1 Tax=Actinomycetospora sp. TBRC 11914 TaxID=2729387 RepID=UPI002896D14A|nr:tyrosine-type recombinase/integrase [Actinomycetospora sp. TBRC 11914]